MIKKMHIIQINLVALIGLKKMVSFIFVKLLLIKIMLLMHIILPEVMTLIQQQKVVEILIGLNLLKNNMLQKLEK